MAPILVFSPIFSISLVIPSPAGAFPFFS